MPCFHPPASPPAPLAALSAAMGRAPLPAALVLLLREALLPHATRAPVEVALAT